MNKGSGSVKKTLFFGFMALLFAWSYQLPVVCADKWPGVDESVVEKYAKEHGREAREPMINTDQGDLLLFVFLLAGVMGGFIGGYSWRMLVSEKAAEPRENGTDTIDEQ
jgi:cobalt/nickel transport protein